MKNEEQKVVVNEMKEAEEKRVVLGGTCEVLESTLPRYEVEIPEIVLVELGLDVDKDPIKDQIKFIQENGRIYLEKA